VIVRPVALVLEKTPSTTAEQELPRCSSQALDRAAASERACVRVAVTGTALSRRTEPNHLVDSGLDTSAAEPSLYVNSERIRA